MNAIYAFAVKDEDGMIFPGAATDDMDVLMQISQGLHVSFIPAIQKLISLTKTSSDGRSEVTHEAVSLYLQRLDRV